MRCYGLAASLHYSWCKGIQGGNATCIEYVRLSWLAVGKMMRFLSGGPSGGLNAAFMAGHTWSGLNERSHVGHLVWTSFVSQLSVLLPDFVFYAFVLLRWCFGTLFDYLGVLDVNVVWALGAASRAACDFDVAQIFILVPVHRVHLGQKRAKRWYICDIARQRVVHRIYLWTTDDESRDVYLTNACIEDPADM